MDRGIFDENGNIFEIQGTGRDITERKEAGDRLRNSEESYRLLFEGNPLPMWIYDLKTLAFLKVNDAAMQHYGYSMDEFMVMTIKDIRPPDDVPALLENLASVTHGIDKAGLWRHCKKDGTVILVEIISHLLDFEGRRSELVLAIDVTQNKQIEDAEHEQRVLAEALRNTAETLGSSLNFGEVLDQILTTVDSVVPCDAATIMLIDKETDLLLIEMSKGARKEQDQQVRVPKGIGIAGRVAASGEPLLVEDIEHDARIGRKNQERYKSASFVSVPLKIGPFLISARS